MARRRTGQRWAGLGLGILPPSSRAEPALYGGRSLGKELDAIGYMAADDFAGAQLIGVIAVVAASVLLKRRQRTDLANGLIIGWVARPGAERRAVGQRRLPRWPGTSARVSPVS